MIRDLKKLSKTKSRNLSFSVKYYIIANMNCDAEKSLSNYKIDKLETNKILIELIILLD